MGKWRHTDTRGHGVALAVVSLSVFMAAPRHVTLHTDYRARHVTWRVTWLNHCARELYCIYARWLFLAIWLCVGSELVVSGVIALSWLCGANSIWIPIVWLTIYISSLCFTLKLKFPFDSLKTVVFIVAQESKRLKKIINSQLVKCG